MSIAGIVVENDLTGLGERVDYRWIPEINGASDVVKEEKRWGRGVPVLSGVTYESVGIIYAVDLKEFGKCCLLCRHLGISLPL
jgi:hypothetical protein